MKSVFRYWHRVLLLMALFFTFLPAASIAAPPDPPPIESRMAAAGFYKALAVPGVLDATQPGITLWHDYGAFSLYKVEPAALVSLSVTTREQVTLLQDANQIQIDAYPFDTQVDTFERIPESLRVVHSEGAALHLIQFVGPIKEAWLDSVRATGATPVHYIANYGYLVWADDAARAQLTNLAAQGDVVQFSAPYQPYFKFGASLQARIDAGKVDGTIDVTIQMYNHPGKTATEALIRDLAVAELSPWTPILAYQNLIATVRVRDLETLARQPDVFWIGERFPRKLNDEVQGQILAGNFDAGQTGPSAPGYLAFLGSYGFSTDPADYPIVDVTDDGIGDGTVNSGDYTLHYLGSASNAPRLQYVSNCTSEASGESVGGHGHINVSIVGGYDPHEGGGFPYEDPDGYLRGLGVSPYGRIAGTRIFDTAGYDVSTCGGTDTGVIKQVQDNGAQINTNSWGCSGCAGSYDESSQAYDVGVRDADLTENGNQELIIFFSAGNSGSGAGTIGTPGNGKNMITVGASENDRPSDEDGNWVDGCGIGPTGADNAMDVISFSSRGPAPGGRVKPEIIAPGTHIQGTASTSSSYNGSGVCDQYRPSGQTTFAASSGTSHSTPAAAGVGSLTYYWLETEYGVTPSPAMMKAYLIAHPTYLTGVSANDTLPSNNQGYGMPNLQLAFDNSQRYLLDQTHLFGNTGETWVYEGIVSDASRPVRIVLAYTDAAGAIGTSPEVNDLNLTVVVDGVTYLGNVFSGQLSTTGGSADADNNYEAVFLPAGTSGNVEITVTAFNVAGDGVPNVGDATDQDFALVVYNVTQGATGTLNGTVTEDGTATPIENALVVAHNPTHTLDFSTNALGFYSGTLLADVYTVTAQAYGYSPATLTGVDVISGAITTRNFSLSPTSSYLLTGTVTDANTGWPLYASVEIEPDGYPTQTVWTDPWTGVYSVTLVGNYTHTLSVAPWSGIPGYVGQSRQVNLSAHQYNENFALAADAVACNAPGYFRHGLSEGFEGAFPPAGWSVYETGDTNGPGWQRGTTGTTGSNGGPHSGDYYAWHNDDNLATAAINWLVLPQFAIPAGGATLSFWQRDYYQTYYEYHGVWVTTGASPDPSASTYVELWTGDTGSTWIEQVIDLSAYAGQTIYLAFRYEGDYMDEWYIDDVSILGPCMLPAGGLIAGSVYNRYSLAPLTGATVGNQDGYTQTAQTTPADEALGESFYVLYSPAGSKTFTATASGYAPVVLDNVPVVAGETGRQDFLFGNAFVSQQTGDWSGSAWVSGTPTATDWVTVSTGHTVTVDSTAAACYGLTIMPDGMLVIPEGHTLAAAIVDNQGTLRQTKSVPGTGDVDFHLRDGGGAVSYYGVLFEATGYNMGTTTVDIHGGVINGTGTLNQTVGRWFDIAPEYALASLPTTFYYAEDELNGNAAATLDVYHYGGSGLWDVLTTLARGGSGAARYITAEIGPDFSPFVIKSPDAPTVVQGQGLAAKSGATLVILMGLVALGALFVTARKLSMKVLRRFRLPDC